MDIHDYLPLSPRDLLTLLVLSEQPLHGYGIIKAVEERSRAGVLLDPANLYRALHRMRRDGWIEDVPDDEDKRRRTFRVTPLGRRVLDAEVARLERVLGWVSPAGTSGL